MDVAEKNEECGKTLKSILGLRYEPVAVRLIRQDDTISGTIPEKQMSHCQAVMHARLGNSFVLPTNMQECKIGASALGMMPTPDKVRSGEFHFNIGAHDTVEATEKMIADRSEIDFLTIGVKYAPLSQADFVPDVVIFEDIPERIYWFVPLSTAEEGGRAYFSTAPFQAACVDAVAVPMTTGHPNISLGCFGCRRRTDLRPDELMIGVPYKNIPEMCERLKKYEEGIMKKAKRD